MAQRDILYCKECRKQVEVLQDCPEELYCCKEKMIQLPVHTSGQGEVESISGFSYC